MHIQGGGPVANALVALNRWGLPCYISAVVGDDAFGKTIADSLREEGIDTGGLVTRIGHLSQFAFIVTEPDMARRTIFWQRPTGMPLQPDDLNLEVLLKSRALHTDGIFTEASIFFVADPILTALQKVPLSAAADCALFFVIAAYY